VTEKLLASDPFIYPRARVLLCSRERALVLPDFNLQIFYCGTTGTTSADG